MRVVGIIPARLGSSRFPGKPLAPILGRPMIEHVYRRTAAAKVIDALWVATCDQDIREAAESFGGQVIMTSADHQGASDRVAEAARQVDAEIVVMIQGDEPMVRPEMIELAIIPFCNERDVACVNLVARIETVEELLNPNVINVVMDRSNNALYFSREPIPCRRVLGFERIAAYKQVCIIPFRHETLMKFADLSPTPLEQAESIDMLRLLEHGYKVRLVETEFETHAVDIPEDILKVEELIRKDPLTKQYLKEPLAGSGTGRDVS